MVVTGALAASGALGGAAVASATGTASGTAKQPSAVVTRVAASGLSAATAAASGQAQSSANWAGYVADASNGSSFRRVSGSWTVPSVSASSGDGYSAFWVGLGGASGSSQALEQIGTSSDVSGGQVSYDAWYELVPAAEQRLSLTVHPGDHMTGSVSVSGTSVTVSLTDATTGASVTKTLAMSSPDTSTAEWIAEAPSVETRGGQVIPTPLADFGTVTFTNATATSGSHTGPINDSAWSSTPIELDGTGAGYLGAGGRFGVADVTSTGSGSATPSGLSGHGSSFTVTAGTSTSAATTSTAGYGGYGYGGYGYGGGAGGDPGAGDEPGYGYGGYGGYGGGYGGYGAYGGYGDAGYGV